MEKQKRDHIVNLYVNYDLKSALEQLAQRRDQTLSSVIRRVLRIGVPILQRLWDTEDQLLREQSELLHEVKRAEQGSAAGKEPGGNAS